jgi:hypothetical protein
MTPLPDVTVVAITTKDYGKTIEAIHKTLQQIKPAKVILFTDVVYMDDAWQNIVIDRFKSVADYNHFVFKMLWRFIETSHVLVIQHDGFVINGSAWDDDFLNYDYIGAKWDYTDGRNVGNGGFSLRSRRLHSILMSDEFEFFSPEDEKICRYYRQTLEMKYGIKFATEDVADKFSYELHKPIQPTFGFHNYFHQRYREPIILRRTGAMGDVLMMEPLMEELHNMGYRVILDTQPRYFNLFGYHYFPIELLSNIYANENTSDYRVVNLDMAYEVVPKQLVSLAYAQACGITLKPRNSRLNFKNGPESMPLFDKYILLHTDDTAMPHRNVHGVDWERVAEMLEDLGWLVLRVGHGNGKGGVRVNAHNENMLAWIVAGAHYFIGPDSGVAQIAVACGVKSMIFFGSVNPQFRYVLDDTIVPIQNLCPQLKDGCYHNVISVIGQDCVVDKETPPCIMHSTLHIIDQIKVFIGAHLTVTE